MAYVKGESILPKAGSKERVSQGSKEKEIKTTHASPNRRGVRGIIRVTPNQQRGFGDNQRRKENEKPNPSRLRNRGKTPPPLGRKKNSQPINLKG